MVLSACTVISTGWRRLKKVVSDKSQRGDAHTNVKSFHRTVNIALASKYTIHSDAARVAAKAVAFCRV